MAAPLDDTPDPYLYARSAGAGWSRDGPDPAAAWLDPVGGERVIKAMGRDGITPAEEKGIT